MGDKEQSARYTQLGLSCLQSGHAEDAIENFNIAVKYNSGNLAAWVNLGSALQQLGRYDEAIDIAESILRQNWPLTDEHLGLIYYNYGNIFRELGNKRKDKELAIKAIEKYMIAIEKRPNHAGTWFNLGQCYYTLGKFEKATEAYKRTLEINPSHDNARIRLEMLKNMSDEEIKFAKEALESPVDDYQRRMIECEKYILKDDHKKAIESLVEVMRAYPEEARPYIKFAQAGLEMIKLNNEFDSKIFLRNIEMLEIASKLIKLGKSKHKIDIFDGMGEIHYQNALNYLCLNQLDEALIECENAIKIDKNNNVYKEKYEEIRRMKEAGNGTS